MTSSDPAAPAVALAELSSLRETLEAHGLLAKKSFGQHFLLDLNITRKIVRLAGPFDGRTVIEVGPGPGGLTRALLESDAGHVIAVEKDARFIPLLSELAEVCPGRFTVLEADATRVDEVALLEAHTPGQTGHLVSNLPYNVGTPLLIKWLTGPWRFQALTLMFQLEVARRIVATVGDDDYGRLAVISQALCQARMVLELPARAFTPPPKVASAVVHLTPLPDRLSDRQIRTLENLTAAAFGQRRKMLRASLKGVGGEALCEAAGIIPTARAEEVDVAGFLRLTQARLDQIDAQRGIGSTDQGS